MTDVENQLMVAQICRLGVYSLSISLMYWQEWEICISTFMGYLMQKTSL